MFKFHFTKLHYSTNLIENQNSSSFITLPIPQFNNGCNSKISYTVIFIWGSTTYSFLYFNGWFSNLRKKEYVAHNHQIIESHFLKPGLCCTQDLWGLFHHYTVEYCPLLWAGEERQHQYTVKSTNVPLWCSDQQFRSCFKNHTLWWCYLFCVFLLNLISILRSVLQCFPYDTHLCWKGAWTLKLNTQWQLHLRNLSIMNAVIYTVLWFVLLGLTEDNTLLRILICKSC